MTTSGGSSMGLAPPGHIWLPDSIQWETSGPSDFGRVREALATGQIAALLRTKCGEIHAVPSRIWGKEPVAEKVLPRFVDGQMRFHVDAVGKTKKVAGGVFVAKGAVRELIKGRGACQTRARFSSAELEGWYKAYVVK